MLKVGGKLGGTIDKKRQNINLAVSLLFKYIF